MTNISMEKNPLLRAADDYVEMEQRLEECQEKVRTLTIDNGVLLAEVKMLREELARADADRIRLQAVASTLSGELLSINDVIAGAVRRALESGVSAARKAQQAPPAAEKPAQEAALVELEKLTEAPKALQAPPQAAGTALPGKVDWAQVGQGKPS